jgi:hypothetical protein
MVKDYTNLGVTKQSTVDPIKKKKSRTKFYVLFGCFGAILFFMLFAAGIMGLVFSIMKRSDAYTGSLERIKISPQVIAVVGEPIETGFFMSGSVNVSGSSGNADIEYNISGPKDEAKVYVKAYKNMGTWYFTQIVVKPSDSDEKIWVIKN